MHKVTVVVLIAVFISALGLAAQSQAQTTGFVETENIVNSASVTPQVNFAMTGPYAEHSQSKWQWSVWGIAAQHWGEFYAGPAYSPAKWITFSAFAGVEKAANPYRVSASVWMSHGKFSYYSSQEYGGTGYWGKNLVTYQAAPRVGIGVWNQTYLGTGPSVKFKTIKHLDMYCAPLFKSEGRTNLAVGAVYNF